MTRQELFSALDHRIPVALREEWDNDGALFLPNPDRRVARVLCTLDVSDEVVKYAQEGGFDLILSHHPLIFGGVRAINGSDAVSRRLLALFEADVAVFSFHTRLDAMEGGVNDALARMLGISAVTPIDDGEGALGRIGTLASPMPFEDFAARVKKTLELPLLNVKRRTDTVYRVAIVGGEGKDFISSAERAGADTYLSGRLGYHAMLDGQINLIECGHYGSEKHTATLLADLVKEVYPEARTEIYAPNSLAIY